MSGGLSESGILPSLQVFAQPASVVAYIAGHYADGDGYKLLPIAPGGDGNRQLLLVGAVKGDEGIARILLRARFRNKEAGRTIPIPIVFGKLQGLLKTAQHPRYSCLTYSC